MDIDSMLKNVLSHHLDINVEIIDILSYEIIETRISNNDNSKYITLEIIYEIDNKDNYHTDIQFYVVFEKGKKVYITYNLDIIEDTIDFLNKEWCYVIDECFKGNNMIVGNKYLRHIHIEPEIINEFLTLYEHTIPEWKGFIEYLKKKPDVINIYKDLDIVKKNFQHILKSEEYGLFENDSNDLLDLYPNTMLNREDFLSSYNLSNSNNLEVKAINSTLLGSSKNKINYRLNYEIYDKTSIYDDDSTNIHLSWVENKNLIKIRLSNTLDGISDEISDLVVNEYNINEFLRTFSFQDTLRIAKETTFVINFGKYITNNELIQNVVKLIHRHPDYYKYFDMIKGVKEALPHINKSEEYGLFEKKIKNYKWN